MTEEKHEEKGENGGNSWKIYVIKTLERLDNRLSKVEYDHKQDEINSARDIAEIKTKLKMSSAIVSAIVALIITILGSVISAYMIYNGVQDSHNLQPNTNTHIEEKVREDTR